MGQIILILIVFVTRFLSHFNEILTRSINISLL